MRVFSDTIKGILLLGILAALFVPYVQSKFHVIKLAPLGGAVKEPEKKYFSIDDWFSGAYQEQQEKYLNETFGFRNLLIRLNNQISFSVFNKAKANGVVVGKKNYLFEENYIKAYYGTDFIGHDSIYHRMQKLKYIKDTLSKLDKNVIVVFAAGKGSFYPEYIPDKYTIKKGKTNYETYVEAAQQLDIPVIDFNKYFITLKNESPYPLYPQYGIHWSYYGMSLAADSLIRFIEKIRNVDMPNIYWNKIETAQPKEGDYDIAAGMNIYDTLKSFDMAYPAIQMQSDSGKTKPSVLIISDSFYWGMFNAGISSAFDKTQFWFYNKDIYPDSYQSPLQTRQLHIKDELAKYDVVIIMATEATLPRLGWGFIENTYAAYRNGNK